MKFKSVFIFTLKKLARKELTNYLPLPCLHPRSRIVPNPADTVPQYEAPDPCSQHAHA